MNFKRWRTFLYLSEVTRSATYPLRAFSRSRSETVLWELLFFSMATASGLQIFLTFVRKIFTNNISTIIVTHILVLGTAALLFSIILLLVEKWWITFWESQFLKTSAVVTALLATSVGLCFTVINFWLLYFDDMGSF